MIDRNKYAIASIVSRTDSAPDLWIVRIRPEIDFPYRPGQYVTVGLPSNGKVLERPYSICSSPQEDHLELFIERVQSGALSDRLFQLGVGSEVIIRRIPKGVFLKEAPLIDQPNMFISTVTGIAPFISLLRTHSARARIGLGAPARVVVLQGAAKSTEFGYADELISLQREFDWFSYVPTVSRPAEDPGWAGERGRVEDVLRKHADAAGMYPSFGGFFLCGHPGMISAARQVLRRAGFDDGVIREEQYWPD